MKKFTFISVLIALLFLAGSVNANAETITFNMTPSATYTGNANAIGATYVEAGVTCKANNIFLGNLGAGYNPAMRLDKTKAACRFWNTVALPADLTTITITATVAPRVYVGGNTLVGTTDSEITSTAVTGFINPIVPTSVGNVHTYNVSGVSGVRTYFALAPNAVDNLADIKTIVFNYSTAPAVPQTVTFNAGAGFSATKTLTGTSITLPTATAPNGWTFAGWSTSAVASTTTAPTVLLTAGAIYTPAIDLTLYAVYSNSVTTGGGTTTLTIPGNQTATSSLFTVGGVAFSILNSNRTSANVNANGTYVMRCFQITTSGGYITTNHNVWNTSAMPGNITSIVLTRTTNTNTVVPYIYVSTEQSLGTNYATGSTLATLSSNNGNVLTYNLTGSNTYFGVRNINAATLDLASIAITYSSAVTTTTYNSNPAFTTASTGNISGLGLTSTSNLTVGNGVEVTLDDNATLLNLEIQAGGKVTNTSGKTLTVSNITINSDATNGTGTYIETDGSTLTTGGTAVVNQYLGTTRNWYVSPPLSNAKATTGFTYYRRDETAATWPSVTVGASLTPGTGYIALPETAGTAITFTTENGGTLNTGNVPVTLTKSGSGFNLIGNPYPSHLTWTAAFVNDPTNTALIEPTIWVRTNAKTANSGVDAQWSFITYNAAVSESVPFVNVLIAPMQAFWVKAKAAGTLILDSKLTRSHQASNSNPLKAPAVKNVDRQRLRLQVNNGSTTDETLIYFDANASDSYDRFDSPKYMETSASATQLYTTVGTEKLVINGMNSIQLDTPIGIGFVPGTASSFSIKANEVSNLPANVKVILRDYEKNTETDMTDGTAVYTFESTVTSANRFSVIFRSANTTTAIENTGKQFISVYANNKSQLVVNTSSNEGQISVYNAVGQKLYASKLLSTSTLINQSFNSGVFFVKVNMDGKATTHKIIIN